MLEKAGRHKGEGKAAANIWEADMTEIRIVERSGRDTLGEGPLRSPRLNSLFWVDIIDQRLNRVQLENGVVSSWPMPETICWIVERSAGVGFVIGLKGDAALFEHDPFRIERIGTLEPDRPNNRLNDAKVDDHGRIWAGSKDDRDQDATGALYRLDTDYTWSRRDDGYLVANGPTFGLDSRTLYHADTGARVVHAFDLSEDGMLSNKRVWLRFNRDWGYPDGMTTDAEGSIWIAHWAGGRISRFFPDGFLDRSISMPATYITSITFGGADLRRMFVTSAAVGCEHESAAGQLFELDAGVQGIAPRAFLG